MKIPKYLRKKSNGASDRSVDSKPLSRSLSTDAEISPYSSSSSSTSSAASSMTKQQDQEAPPMPRHIQELQHAFRYFDANGDGKISVTELGGVLRSLGDDPSDEDLRLMVKEVDADGDGFVDFDEFVHLNTQLLGDAVAASAEELKAAFYVFDTDRNGYISAEELYAVMFNLGEKGVTMEDCNRMIGGVDADGDGFVNFEEFQRMMLGNAAAAAAAGGAATAAAAATATA